MTLFDNIKKPALPDNYKEGHLYYKRVTFPQPDRWTFANVDTNIVVTMLLGNNCANYWPYEDGTYDLPDYKSIWKQYDYDGHCDSFKIIANNDIIPGNWVIAGVYMAQT